MAALRSFQQDRLRLRCIEFFQVEVTPVHPGGHRDAFLLGGFQKQLVGLFPALQMPGGKGRLGGFCAALQLSFLVQIEQAPRMSISLDLLSFSHLQFEQQSQHVRIIPIHFKQVPFGLLVLSSIHQLEHPIQSFEGRCAEREGQGQDRRASEGCGSMEVSTKIHGVSPTRSSSWLSRANSSSSSSSLWK